MQDSKRNNQTNSTKRPDIRLPFRHRKSDIGEWAYDHRVALCITVIVFLVGAIVVMSTKIRIGSERIFEGIFVEMQPEETPPPPPIDQQKLAEELDFSDIKNMVSNENAKSELNEKLRDSKGSNAEEIYDEANAVQDRIKSNRALYEKGLREEQAIVDAKQKSSDKVKQEDSKVKGRVTVSFSFTNPVRNSSRLVIPAYMCEGGGQIVLNVTLNHNGNVISTSVDRAQSSTDNCMITTAINAAKGSRFNLDTSAPEKHQGTITYIFIPQ